MDVSLYDFTCQKALHTGLKYARSLGHPQLEVEHIALAMIRTKVSPLAAHDQVGLSKKLEAFLGAAPRVFGNFKIEFGTRINAALDRAESQKKPTELVEEVALWEALCRESTVIRNYFATSSGKTEDVRPEESFQPFTAQNLSAKKSDATSKKEEEAPQTFLSEKHLAKLRPYTVDLTEKAERNELDPVLGRDAEVRRTLEILGRKKKNNPILIGEPGVGKSAIAEALAIRIAQGKVAETIKGKRVMSLDLGSLIAGSRLRGEFEARLKGVLEAVEASSGSIILFIDEIHTLVGAGNPEGAADAANLLKPALARGSIRCLGATTLDEFRRHIEKDAALERRFQPLMVEEPSPQSTLAILRGIKPRYEIHHGVQITDDALRAAVELSVRYLSNRRLPDKAIDLIDEAASRLRLQIDSMPSVMDSLRATIEELEIERQAIGNQKTSQRALVSIDVRLRSAKAEYAHIEKAWNEHKTLLDELRALESRHEELTALLDNAKNTGDFEFAARVQYGEEPKVVTRLEEVRNQLDAMLKLYPYLHQAVGPHEIAHVIAAWTRIPSEKLLENERSKILRIEERLRQRVFGQDQALRLVGQAIKRSRTGISDPGRPNGIFLFLGPTGVGKTETAKALAEELFDDDTRMLRFDMSEFMESHSVARLIGSPPGYVGYRDRAELADGIREQPYSVILFDEIEKAHAKILDILLQILEDGRLTDGRGKTADFKNAIIIMTSNLVTQGQGIRDADLRGHLGKMLRPEFVNRIDEIVVFRKLEKEHLLRMLARQLQELNLRLTDRQFRVSLGPQLTQRLIQPGLDSASGGRGLRRAFETLVNNPVSDRLLAIPELCAGTWRLEWSINEEPRWTEVIETHRYLPLARLG